jgi:epoxide hydrolase-like predicted phosphatase
MTDIRWYRTLALWKSIVFMEGNYKRALSGRTDDPYLKGFGEGVIQLARARRRWPVAAERSAVLLDWGGVMTGDLFGSFAAFCADEGLDPDVLANLFRHDRDARALLIDFECGRIEEVDFEPRLSSALGLAWHDGLIDRLFAGAALDDAMVEGVRALHDRGIATGLVSNSWGTRRYPRDLLAELFDGIVISGEEGFRKPDPRMYELGAQRVGAEPSACVFVDDLAFNLDPARELGMAVVHHTSAASTLAELERLVG